MKSPYMNKILNIGLTSVLAIFIVGCSKSTYNSFQDKVAAYAKDQVITQQEYEDLANYLKNNDESWAANIKDKQGKVNNQILKNLLVTIAKQKKISISEQSIWQPNEESKSSKFNVDVLFENSASMDGYVNGETDFKATTLELFSKLKNANYVNTLSYGFVSDGAFTTQPLNNIDEIKKFSDSLSPTLLQKQAGERGASDIAKLISDAVKLPALNNKGVVVLISDYIFSPPSGKNAQDYLSSQGAYLEGIISQKIKNTPNFSILILKFNSKYNGLYYDKNGATHNLNAQRPYYIWFLGDRESILDINNNLTVSKLNQFQNQLLLVNKSDSTLAKYKVLTTSLLGASPQASFDAEEALKNNRIVKAKPIINQRPIFNVDIAVDLSQTDKNLDQNQIQNSKNYKVSDPSYVISKVKVADEISKQSLPSATNVLTLSYVGTQPQINKADLKIEFQPEFPEWIQKSSTLDDTAINNSNASATGTFGLDTLIKSAYQAFNTQNKPNNFFELSIEP